MIYGVLEKLTARGAAMTRREEGMTEHAPVAATGMPATARQQCPCQ